MLNQKLRIGTSGYSYDDWLEVFYPKGLPKNKMLEFYAKHFNFGQSMVKLTLLEEL